MNIFATIALAMFPLLALIFYSTRPAGQATVLTFLSGQLLLPVGAAIKFQMVPPIDKNSVVSFAALVARFCRRDVVPREC